ncbi:MAG: hypothetical protein ACE5NM_05015 [Sedimentisphaerales bacterium]
MIKRRIKLHDTRYAIRNTHKKGAALLVVLFVVMAITILSLGFLSRSDVELACGQNMVLRTQMDYLAESGLQHAKGLILNPQDVEQEYWTGAASQQLVAGSDDYYDVVVVRDDSDPANRCNYIIDCNSYRLKAGEEVGRSNLRAELRLDPCIAYWTGADTKIGQRFIVNGDVYCNGELYGNGRVQGDAFASGNITVSNVLGQKNESVIEPPVDWPGLNVSDFSSMYYIGSESYSPHIVDVNVHPAGNFVPSGSNPAGVRYCIDNIILPGGVDIEGMLVVNGTLTITGATNVISAVKNFPALLVSGEVVMKDGATLQINGLAQIGQRITIEPEAGYVDIDVVGGLFIANGDIDGQISSTISIDITAGPAIAAIQTWPTAGTANRWTPAGGAFFKSIQRR